MQEARYYEKLENYRVLCRLCPHLCDIGPGRRGICAVRENRDGVLYSLVYGRMAASHVDPIEKKPLFHFLPGSRTYSVSTVGCNLSCPFCQNHEISLVNRGDDSPIAGYPADPDRVVSEAVRSGCESLCFTYTEPTVFFEYMADMAQLARKRGLRTTMVSNGFVMPEPRREMAELIDAANIDLKAFDPETYRKVLKAKLEPVLDSIRELHDAGVWIELTTLVVPGMNDSEKELTRIAEFISGLDKDIPWHVSRFFPSHRWRDRRPTGVETIRMALEIGRRAGLNYVYAGNLPGDSSESTFCPGCKQKAIERWGYRIGSRNLDADGLCGSCRTPIAGVFDSGG
jgi:pyruvate formate lyase activating enzyme